ncbi:tetratricopeptide repeat protein [Aureimonas jatrophae]|uniref:Tetratricopeptide repeat-containing protein n=1 Tax=Aureimonas jatrophae TaxID=1166073 RepID=A0A1H0GLA2_9HYPH|nr:tetratricopeptide repeat protein [Aureimonas jatrophae]MBB3949633.1 tetratricopeptide (TPR) repeat protein [Aureimonas jatrophae]SDO07717.1 Tetratricopeptide repeat-containing protein [Aureimonas jatrophae]
MDKTRITRIARHAALAGVLIMPLHVAYAQDAAKPEMAPSAVQTLSGAYLAAKQARENRQPDIAAQYYDRALALDPDSEVLQQEAMFAYLADGRFDRGVALAGKLTDNADVGKVARIALGLDALRQGRFDAAIEEWQIGDTSDLDTLLLAQLASWADVGAGRTKAALARLDKLQGATWFAAFNQYQTGLIAALGNDLPRARKSLNALLDDDGSAQTSVDAYLAGAEALGRIEARAKRKPEALAAVDKGLALAPSYEPLTQLRKQIDDGKPVDAPYASARNGAAEALYILGQAINRGDGQDVALLYFQFAKAVADRPDDKLLTALAGIADRSQQVDLAISYYEQIPDGSPYRRTAELQMGLDLWQAERKPEATEHLRTAVERYPDDLQARLALADVLSADKNYGEAVEMLDKALSLAPTDSPTLWNIHYQRGIAFERLKQWEKAELDFKKALELSPDQPQVLNYLGYSWVDMNRNLDEGLEMIRTAVDLRPNDGYIIDSLGWAYYRLGRFEDAVEQLERAVLITPADPTINDHLGDAYWRVGRTREARFQWNRALAGQPAPEAADVERIKQKVANGLEAGTVPVKATAPDAAPTGDRASNDVRSSAPSQPN